VERNKYRSMGAMAGSVVAEIDIDFPVVRASNTA
jgi:hypothetical protein